MTMSGADASGAWDAHDQRELVVALRQSISGEVDASTRRRAEYSTDASNYRVVPRVVIYPRAADDIVATVEVARSAGVSVTMRGGGTSVAGNAIGTGIVVDTSRHLNRILGVDAANRTATVEPGVVLADLQAAVRRHGLRFGPDPSTHGRATLGGMIGNKACGAHSVAYGRTSDSVVEMTVVDGSGRRLRAGAGLEVVPGLSQLVQANLASIRTEFGKFGRQVSGYSLEHLLPERGANLARAIVGTEGTVACVLDATIELVPLVAESVLVVLGYADVVAAADAVPALLPHEPLAIEGIDSGIIDVVRRYRGAVPDLPPGDAWLMVEIGGTTSEPPQLRVAALVRDAGGATTRVLKPGPEARAVWRIREDGAGLASRASEGHAAWPGWEDAAVPPQQLGSYLRAFAELTRSYGYEGHPYGHFADGCVHVRLTMPLDRASDVPAFRSFMTDAAGLVVQHGGSLSGEHGDGRARSELLPQMYSPSGLELLAAFKNLLDPSDVLNPGVIVRPRPLDVDLRRPAARAIGSLGFLFADDGGDFTSAAHRCVGVGKCRTTAPGLAQSMCPSFMATRDEKDSTRGRARVLQEMANGSLISTGWPASEVRQSLDLCLSCKACARECPAGVDMAQLKSEVLHRTYRRRPRPISHYSLGQLPRWARLASKAPRFTNAVLRSGLVGQMLLPLAGIDRRRSVPPFADDTFRGWWRRSGGELSRAFDRSPRADASNQVVLWADCFSDYFSSRIPRAAVDVLHAAGWKVIVPERSACCALTWISTGQLDGARKRLRRAVDVLGPYAAAGTPIVGLEPSCTAVLRSDLRAIVGDAPAACAVASGVHTLAEFLSDRTPGWEPPELSDTSILAQPHCHHQAVMGYETDLALLRRAGAEPEVMSGCCGLAGNFGMERGHYDLSVAIASRSLLPSLRDSGSRKLLLADGFSCRLQALDLADVDGVHLAELLARRLPSQTVRPNNDAVQER
jgi:FAD/FMN-containing dehydrogenase/Fe-S oxidoreductase